MSLTSRSTAVLLASAVAGLATVGHAASDDWEAPVASAVVGDDLDCDAPDSDEPRDEQMVIEELITELRCLDAGIPQSTQGMVPPPERCFPPRCCITVTD